MDNHCLFPWIVHPAQLWAGYPAWTILNIKQRNDWFEQYVCLCCAIMIIKLYPTSLFHCYNHSADVRVSLVFRRPDHGWRHPIPHGHPALVHHAVSHAAADHDDAPGYARYDDAPEYGQT